MTLGSRPHRISPDLGFHLSRNVVFVEDQVARLIRLVQEHSAKLKPLVEKHRGKSRRISHPAIARAMGRFLQPRPTAPEQIFTLTESWEHEHIALQWLLAIHGFGHPHLGSDVRAIMHPPTTVISRKFVRQSSQAELTHALAMQAHRRIFHRRSSTERLLERWSGLFDELLALGGRIRLGTNALLPQLEAGALSATAMIRPYLPRSVSKAVESFWLTLADFHPDELRAPSIPFLPARLEDRLRTLSFLQLMHQVLRHAPPGFAWRVTVTWQNVFRERETARKMAERDVERLRANGVLIRG